MAKLYNFDDMTMTNKNGNKNQNKSTTITTQHAYVVTITTMKQFGAIWVSFASVLFNLQHKHKYTLFRDFHLID